MAFIQVDFYSQALQVGVSINVIMPEAAGGAVGIDAVSRSDPPVLYLLHGRTDDHTIWMRRTSIERYAASYGLAVVMPAVGRSFYCDMASGPAYWTYVSEELPEYIERTFRVGSGRSNRLVAGLSMGGYGALKLALTHPDRYAAAASFSGALDVARLADAATGVRTDRGDPGASVDPLRVSDMYLTFGDPPVVSGTGNDLFHLAARAATRTDRPALYLACGSEDLLFEDSNRLHAHLASLGIEHDYYTEPGTHEWGLWDRHVERFLAWAADRW